MKLHDAYGRSIHPDTSHGSDSEHCHQGEHSNPGENRAANNSDEPIERTSSNESSISAQKSQNDTYKEKQYRLEKGGLMTQVALCVFTALAFGAAAYYAHVANLQLGTMQRQLEATDRPWIKITSVKPREDFTFFLTKDNPRERNWKTQANETIDIVAKNIGHSVALKVFVKGRMTFTEDIEKLIEERNSVCSGSPLYAFPVNLFPDEDTGNSQFIMGAEIVPSREKSSPPLLSAGEVPSHLPPDTWIASPKFVGCIIYTIANTGSTHYTGFIYWMGQTDTLFEGFSYTPRFFKVGENVPKDKLSIAPYFEGFDLN